MEVIIMAGGKGTRLSGVFKEIPKSMFPIQGKPLLEYQVEALKKSGIRNIRLVIGYLGEVIKEYFKDGKDFGVGITYFEENVPLGSAGALALLKEELDNDFLLLFGDVFFDIDLFSFSSFHKQNGSEITLFVHPNSHPYDSDLVVCNSEHRVIQWDSKYNTRNYDYNNLVNAGLYILSKNVLGYISNDGKKDLEKDLIVPAILDGRKVYAYHSTEYVKDMGTPERYTAVKLDVEKGIPKARNKAKKQKCIFLDRDGTINKYVGFLTRPDQMELLENSAEAIRLINNSEYLCIVITNQPVIARGECTFEELEDIHRRLQTLLGQEHAYIDDLFFCPHHPHKGYDGEIAELKIECDCRKPKIRMFQDASIKYNIDFEQSYMIGDSIIDVEAGSRAGLKTILVKTGEMWEERKYNTFPHYNAEDLLDAVKIILEKVSPNID